MQHLGLLSVVLLAIGLTVTAMTLPGGLQKTFSQRVANNTKAELYYALLFIAVLPLLYVFFLLWFVPVIGIHHSFLWFAAVAILFQIACTFVPERGGVYTIVHRVLTAISGVALLPLVAIMATTPSISELLQQAMWVIFVLMVVLLLIALINQKGFKYALLLQIGYYALFFCAVLLVTYA